MLLCDGPEQAGTLVVSAIYGLGGIGKSVIAAALCHDAEVQAQFPDGILWVTLGQQPDLQASLGGWIQALRDFDYKPTTVEAASTHLRTLLHNKQVLLVVDDAWQSDHVVPFQIGGSGCRVLVTTREAVIPDAERYDLDVMNTEQAMELLRNYSSRSMAAQEQAEALAFAKSVGYLPLALELAAVQISNGFSWAELLGEFEREVAELELLDSREVQNYKHEEKRKRLSLRACFNLSLRRLSLEQLKQFAWLGVLPEDVIITKDMAATLWQLSHIRAKKLLLLFKSRALLTSGVSLQGEEATYRLHDLMHDTARWLLEQPILDDCSEQLSGLGLSWEKAQQQFLKKFRVQVAQGKWWELEDDGYIYRYLTWHLEQAGLIDEIHELLAASNENGRNAWYEACERLGDPTIFLQDVARAWKLAKANDCHTGVNLQVRYALIQSTMNSIAKNVPLGLIKTLLESSAWTSEQAWIYIERIESEYSFRTALKYLDGNMSDYIAFLALEKSKKFSSLSNKLWCFCVLIPFFPNLEVDIKSGIKKLESKALSPKKYGVLDSAEKGAILKEVNEIKEYFGERMSFSKKMAVRGEMNLERNGNSLSTPSKSVKSVSESNLILSRIKNIKESYDQAKRICDESTTLHPDCIGKALDVAESIAFFNSRSRAINSLASRSPEAALRAFQQARCISDTHVRVDVMLMCSDIDSSLVKDSLRVIPGIRDEYMRAHRLRMVYQMDASLRRDIKNIAEDMSSSISKDYALSAFGNSESITPPRVLYSPKRYIQHSSGQLFDYLIEEAENSTRQQLLFVILMLMREHFASRLGLPKLIFETIDKIYLQWP